MIRSGWPRPTWPVSLAGASGRGSRPTCWRAVGRGRRGRALAESMREVAPQRLRERVRATVAATPPTRRRARRSALAATMAMAVLAAVVAGGLLLAQRPTQPPAIAAAVAGYRTGVPAWTGVAEPPAA